MSADREDAKLFFVTKMAALYSPPYQKDAAAVALALDEYINALRHYTPTILSAAWESISHNHKKQGWPVLGECLKACEEAKRGKYGMRKPYVDPYEKKPEPINPLLTEKQLKKLHEDIATCDRLAARGVVKDYFGRILDNSKYTKLGKIGRGILAKHERAVGSAGG